MEGLGKMKNYLAGELLQVHEKNPKGCPKMQMRPKKCHGKVLVMGDEVAVSVT